MKIRSARHRLSLCQPGGAAWLGLVAGGIASLGLAACASDPSRAPPGATSAANLRALPPGLGFDCVAPGCRQERAVLLLSEGPSAARIFALKLDPSTSADFEVAPDQAPAPFDIGAGQSAEVKVVYEPSDALPDAGALVVEFGTPEGRDLREVRVELLARTLGAPAVEVSPPLLSFGFIPAGATGMLDLRVRNTGTGNAVLGVSAAAFDTGVDYDLAPAARPPLFLAPREEATLTVTYRPTNDGVHVDRLRLRTNDPDRAEVEVIVRGTSVPGARASLEEAGPFDFGDVRAGGSAEKILRIANHGGDDLEILDATWSGPGAAHFQVNPPATAAGPIAPFGAAALTITYAPADVGDHEATLAIATNDPLSPDLSVAFRGRGVHPGLAVSPVSVDYGRVVLGWTRGPTSIEARNDGFGPLRIERVFMAPGSSAEFEIRGVPALPATLEGGERVVLEVLYVASSLSTVQGRLVLESDDPEHPRIEVPISGEGVSCEVGCAMAHATPRCDSGVCEIASCEAGYYDTDAQAATGCECAIERPEPSRFCAEATFLGSLVDDNGDRRTVTGQLHHSGDVDWYSFFAVDSGGINELFGDDFHVRINFSGPPGYKICVFRAKRGAHEDVCPAGAGQACSGTLAYDDDGSYGSDDSADYFIKVWTDQPQTTCQPYTLSVRNG